MTKVFRDQSFERWFDDGGRMFTDLEFWNCTFRSCDVSITRDPQARSVVRRALFKNCTYIEAGGLSCPIVEDVVIDGLKTRGLLQTWCMVFSHVVIKGRVGRIMTSPLHRSGLSGSAPHSVQAAFDEDNRKYYSKVDWALDISQAEFVDCDIRGIPARLVRRDPETQVVVTRDKALHGDWRALDFGDTAWAGWLQLFIDSGESDVVLAAPKAARNFREELRGLQLLRKSGVAEPD